MTLFFQTGAAGGGVGKSGREIEKLKKERRLCLLRDDLIQWIEFNAGRFSQLEQQASVARTFCTRRDTSISEKRWMSRSSPVWNRLLRDFGFAECALLQALEMQAFAPLLLYLGFFVAPKARR
jgi:hypothetical protein